MKPRVYVHLGRAGDVINFLPVLKERFDETGEVPELVVQAEFAPLLEGVSYARPLVWEGGWYDCLEATAWAKAQRPEAEVVNSAVCGTRYHFKRRCMSFDRESWRFGGARAPWGRLPLVFDRRDREREAAQLATLPDLGTGRLVVASFSGVSTPFADGGKIVAALEEAGHVVVDVSGVRAPRFFDMLGLLDRAHCLVCNDSALLHLAHAAPSLPVVSLVQDRGDRWQRSSWRPQHAARIFYSEATVDPGAVVSAVNSCRDSSARRRFVHVFGDLKLPGPNDDRRIRVARESWREEFAWAGCWEEFGVPEERFPRSTKSIHGEFWTCPYYRDLIEAAAARCRPRDVIVVSNVDVGIAPGFTGHVLEALNRCGAIYTHRWDYDLAIERPFRCESEVTDGRWYPGSDVWAFTKAWWIAWGDRFPDMILGREAGDMVLRHVVKQGGGVEIPAVVWHEKHPSVWEHHGNREKLPGNVRNRELARAFLAEWGGDWNDGAEVRP